MQTYSSDFFFIWWTKGSSFSFRSWIFSVELIILLSMPSSLSLSFSSSASSPTEWDLSNEVSIIPDCKRNHQITNKYFLVLQSPTPLANICSVVVNNPAWISAWKPPIQTQFLYGFPQSLWKIIYSCFNQEGSSCDSLLHSPPSFHKYSSCMSTLSLFSPHLVTPMAPSFSS